MTKLGNRTIPLESRRVPCSRCGQIFLAGYDQYHRSLEGRPVYCSSNCAYLTNGLKKRKWQETTCHQCGQPFQGTIGQKREMARGNRVYCSAECLSVMHQEAGKKAMAIVHERHMDKIKERMRRHNPMADQVVREKMRTSLSARGWTSPRGGNGTGLTIPERLLSSALNWPAPLVITTHDRKKGYPTCYKVDVGNPILMVAIEIDGRSHAIARQKAIDAKKDAWLREHGWTVLRFSNQEVTAHLEACVQMVLSTTSRLSTTTHMLPTDS
jgi:hypothetical protein